MATQVPLKKSSESPEAGVGSGMLADMERWAESMMPSHWLKPQTLLERAGFAETMPKVDVIDSDSEITVRVAAPGFSKDELEISATDSTVTVRGNKETESESGEKESDFYRREISSSSFLRTIRLPAIIDDNAAKAVYKDGILEMKAPKTERSKRHTVDIA